MANRAPPEVLREVFQHFRADKAQLLSCLVVCLTWYEPAKEELYHTMVLFDESVEKVRNIEKIGGIPRATAEEFAFMLVEMETEMEEGSDVTGDTGAVNEHSSSPIHGVPTSSAPGWQATLSSVDLLHYSLARYSKNGKYIKHLDIQSASGFSVLPLCTSLRRLSVGFDSYISREQAIQALGVNERLVRRNFFSPGSLPYLQELQLGFISPDLTAEIISLCPALTCLDFFATECWRSHDWLDFSYSTVPPLKMLFLQTPGPVSYQAFTRLVGPVAHTLESLFLNNMDECATFDLADGDVDSFSPSFWDRLAFPKLRHLRLNLVDSEGVSRLLNSIQTLESLDFRSMVGEIDAYLFLRVLPASVQNLALHLAADEHSVAEAFISCMEDANWLPNLREIPQIWTDVGITAEASRDYLERLREPCFKRGLQVDKLVEARLLSRYDTF